MLFVGKKMYLQIAVDFVQGKVKDFHFIIIFHLVITLLFLKCIIFEINLDQCRPLPTNSRRLNRSIMDNELKGNNINGNEVVASRRSM